MITKNDLSFNSVKLDHAAFKRALQVCVRELRDGIHRELDSFYLISEMDVRTKHAALHLRNKANELAVVADCLHTWEELATRDNREFVNIEEE